MSSALIVSLGGTTEPIVTSIKTHNPDMVYFFASSRSVEQVPEVLAQLGISLSHENFIVSDANDLIQCYEKAVELAGRIEADGFSPDQVIVDYTGGTKTMTAALTLATVGKGFMFSYVGGRERTKDGLGVVITGTEEVHTGVSPWRLFAVEERHRIALYANTYQFDAAVQAIAGTKSYLSQQERFLFDGLEKVFRGYRAWEGFNHLDAIGDLGRGLRDLQQYLIFKEEKSLAIFF